MPHVRLRGELVCRNADEASVVRNFLAEHIALSRAQPGCRSFDITPTDDPLVWSVSKEFDDAAAFGVHQQMIAASEWGQATHNIQRHYTVEGINLAGR